MNALRQKIVEAENRINQIQNELDVAQKDSIKVKHSSNNFSNVMKLKTYIEMLNSRRIFRIRLKLKRIKTVLYSNRWRIVNIGKKTWVKTTEMQMPKYYIQLTLSSIKLDKKLMIYNKNSWRLNNIVPNWRS